MVKCLLTNTRTSVRFPRAHIKKFKTPGMVEFPCSHSADKVETEELQISVLTSKKKVLKEQNKNYLKEKIKLIFRAFSRTHQMTKRFK